MRTNNQHENQQPLTSAIREKASALGFDACGLARATALEGYKPALDQWLQKGYHGKMAYMANHFAKRLDPRLLSEGARTVVVVAQNYYPPVHQPAPDSYKVSRYAYGKDYHMVMKKKLKALAAFITELAGEHQHRVFTDSAPVLERSWAVEAGLGNTGKNACLILPRKGSYYFLGEVITSIEAEPDAPFSKDLCGKCTRCMDACPTSAIVAPGKVDAGKCLSYLTIELRDRIPEPYRGKTRGWIFGCDICQEVCPHNRHARPHNEKELEPLEPIAEWTDRHWRSCTREAFNRSFKKTGSALSRISHGKLMDNISCADEDCR